MEVCGILHLRARINRVSGGETRRAMLARAFATEPDVFLLDEPTADPDPAATHAVTRLLRGTAESRRRVVVVLHAIILELRHAHRAVVLAAGWWATVLTRSPVSWAGLLAVGGSGCAAFLAGAAVAEFGSTFLSRTTSRAMSLTQAPSFAEVACARPSGRG